MRIEILPAAPIPAELKRAAHAFSEAAQAALRRRSANREKAVHEARKAIRSARALLRLDRGALGKRAYAERNGMLRQAAELLSPHRDAHVLLSTLDALVKRVGDADGLAQPLQRRIAERVELRTGSLDAAARKAEELLGRFRESIEPWPAHRQTGAKAAGKGLRRSYKRVRKRLEQAEGDLSKERVHELRKRGKDVREQLRLLRRLAPDRIDRLEQKFDDLSDDLGEARDLDLADDVLSNLAKNWPAGRALIRKLQQQAASRKEKLVKKGLKRARKATAPSPKSIKRLVAGR